MADYITAEAYKKRHNITSIQDEDLIVAVVTEASRMIDGLCGRQFTADASASTRVFHPTDNYTAWIDDALEITTVKTDTSDNGTFDTTWDSTDFEAWPLNGVGINRLTGWPYTQLVAVGNRTFPSYRRASIEVNAKWGWTAVPDDVVGACYLLANRLAEEKKAPFGTVGSAEFGALPIRDQRTVLRLLAPYMRRHPVVA